MGAAQVAVHCAQNAVNQLHEYGLLEPRPDTTRPYNYSVTVKLPGKYLVGPVIRRTRHVQKHPTHHINVHCRFGTLFVEVVECDDPYTILQLLSGPCVRREHYDYSGHRDLT